MTQTKDQQRLIKVVDTTLGYSITTFGETEPPELNGLEDLEELLEDIRREAIIWAWCRALDMIEHPTSLIKEKLENIISSAEEALNPNIEVNEDNIDTR